MKKHAYLILDVVVEAPDQFEVAGYQPNITAGEIIVRDDNPGTGTHSFVFEDGPVKLVCTGVYVATGKADDDQSPVSFDYGSTRILNLISLGAGSEAILKQQVHEFADKVKEVVEEETTGFGKPIEGTQERILAGIDRAEKEFWRKH